jgi:hypothetical protein
MEVEWKNTTMGGKPMTPLFTATFCYSQDDGTVQMVGLADHEYETNQYVLFQKTIHPTEQDRFTGLDQVHITVNEQNRAMYGGVKKVTLATDKLTVYLSSETAKEVGTDELISVALAPKICNLDLFAAGLRVMFSSIFVDQRC